MTDDDIKRDFVIKLARELFVNHQYAATDSINRDVIVEACFNAAEDYYEYQLEYCKKYESKDNAWENLE